MERNSFRLDSGDSSETMRKLRLSTKSPRQKIKWNYGIFRSVLYQNNIWWTRAWDSRLQILFVLCGFERESSEMQEQQQLA